MWSLRLRTLSSPTRRNENGVALYAGLNIQVHSGLSFRRNGMSWSTASEPLFLYGSDGTAVQPMTEGMSTTGARSAFKGPPTPRTPTKHASTRETSITTRRLATSTTLPTHRLTAWLLVVHRHHRQRRHQASPRFILGDTHTTGAWTATVNISQEFLKDRIPTKVKVVPTLLGYDEVSVAAGASHPSSSALTFKRPLVDYHVLVSLAPADRINATVNLTNSRIGNPTARNFPQSSRLTANMDLEDEGWKSSMRCYTWLLRRLRGSI